LAGQPPYLMKEGGVMEDGRIIKSQFQVIPAEVLEDHRKARLWGYLERNEMNNPVYYRLIGEKDNFVGFKRIVTEYLPAGHNRWQLADIPHDPERTEKLSKPGMGTATLGREKIITPQQIRVNPGPRTEGSHTDIGGVD